MQANRKDWPLTMMCRQLKLAPSGFYAWRTRTAGPRARRREALRTGIRQAHEASHRRYGSPRVTAALNQSGMRCCVNTVAKIMREIGLAARIKRRFRLTTDSNHDLPIAPNRLKRQFARRRPNEAWTADMTYIPTGEGWLFLATVMDLFSRRIVGWSMGERLDTALVSDALSMAIQQRRPPAGLIHHSDRGCQYASQAFRSLLTAHGLVSSMSRRGNAYDNAPMESFYASLKRELVHPTTYATRSQARSSVFEYIEANYNRRRLHSSLDYLSPAAFEARGKFS
jgi:putative transposase